jgi:predicted deacylase
MSDKMSRRTERLPLAYGSPGTARSVLVHRYGSPGRGRKAYLQASLHADEIPAMATLHHLVRLLDAADENGSIDGEIVVVPYANPIGLDQFLSGGHSGRYELASGGNFNRDWPALDRGLAAALDGALGDDPAANVEAIREALREKVEALPAADEMDDLRRLLARLAVDADLVLDLHCDDDALMHLYLLSTHWPDGEDLACDLGCQAVLLADDSGGGPFDECFSTPWLRLAKAFPDKPIPAACLAGTVELRGQSDVDDATATANANALYRILQRRGFIAGGPEPLAPPLCKGTPLAACEVVKAPDTGILSYCVALGETVSKGDLVAWLIDPAAEEPREGRQAIRAGTDGQVLSRRSLKYTRAGWSVAKIAGTAPLAEREGGALLEA